MDNVIKFYATTAITFDNLTKNRQHIDTLIENEVLLAAIRRLIASNTFHDNSILNKLIQYCTPNFITSSLNSEYKPEFYLGSVNRLEYETKKLEDFSIKIDIIIDHSKEMAWVKDGLFGMCGNDWDFHNGCHGNEQYLLENYNTYMQHADAIHKFYRSIGIKNIIKTTTYGEIGI